MTPRANKSRLTKKGYEYAWMFSGCRDGDDFRHIAPLKCGKRMYEMLSKIFKDKRL